MKIRITGSGMERPLDEREGKERRGRKKPLARPKDFKEERRQKRKERGKW